MTTPAEPSERSLLSRLRAVSGWVGLDRPIFYTVVARGWSALAGPISLVFVAQFLTREEQGFYYTFSSVLALQVFFELGLSYVIMQSASHEKAHLEWTGDDARLTGDSRSKARLASLLQFALRWYAVVGCAAAVVLLAIGFWFFRRYEPSGAPVDWQIPWAAVVLLTSLNLLATPFVGVIEGCGKVAEVASLHLRQAIGGSIAVWVGLGFGLKLYAAPLISLVSAGAMLIWLYRRRLPFFVDLLTTKVPPGDSVRWREEILPFQWKIAVSWLSGYFIFHLANPVLFRYHGAVEAGRMGMTMRIVESITALSFAWVSTKSAPFGSYIARRDFATLDSIFHKAAIQSVSVAAAGSGAFIGAYYLLALGGVPLADRLLSPLTTSFLLGNAIINCIIFSEAVYLRAHKQEPLLINSLIGAVMVSAIMYFLGRPYGAAGIAIGLFLGGLLLGLPLATVIFFKKRREWHYSL